MTRDFPAGNYRFIPAVFQYSSGAAADPGFEIERVRFDRLQPLAEGFALAAKLYSGRRAAVDVVLRLRVALAGGVHRGRISNLQRALRQDARRMGPVRRRHQSGGAQQRLSGDRSARAAVLSCFLLLPAGRWNGTSATPSFVIAGGAEARGGSGSYPERIVRYRDLSSDGFKEKVRFTVGAMERRLGRVRVRLERHHRGAGLYRARLPSRDGR